ncbi:hypothetical protein E4U38_001737, partial [Claviceps purpurea]
YREDPRRKSRPQAEVDFPHPPGQDGPAAGPHGPCHVPPLRRIRLCDWRGYPRRWRIHRHV